MGILIRLILIWQILALAFGPALADTIYITQCGTTSCPTVTEGDGSELSPFSIDWFNKTTPAPNISGGNTYIMKGTFTGLANSSMITMPASGISDSTRITILFDTEAIFEAPYFSTNGAINTNGKSYITIDGGSNGLIRNTDNGTSLGNHADSNGVVIGGASSYITLKNLTINPIYVHSTALDNLDPYGLSTYCINVAPTGQNILIDRNTVSWCRGGISYGMAGNNGVNGGITNNKITHTGFGIYLTGQDENVVINGFYVCGNDISDWSGWECPGGGTGGICNTGLSAWANETIYSTNQRVTHAGYIWRSKGDDNQGHDPDGAGGSTYWQNMDFIHQDGIFVSGHHIQATTPVHICRNLIRGLTGGSVSASIYLTYQPFHYTADDYPGIPVIVYSNVLVPNPNMTRTGTGNIVGSGNRPTTSFYNNTIDPGGIGGSCFIFAGTGVKNLLNNICVNAKFGIEAWAGTWTLGTVDYNLWYDHCKWGAHCFSDGVAWYPTLQEWRDAGRDIYGDFADPLFTSSPTGNYGLQAASPARNAGCSTACTETLDLTTIFNTDLPGTYRPVGTAWDMGGYEFIPGQNTGGSMSGGVAQ